MKHEVKLRYFIKEAVDAGGKMVPQLVSCPERNTESTARIVPTRAAAKKYAFIAPKEVAVRLTPQNVFPLGNPKLALNATAEGLAQNSSRQRWSTAKFSEFVRLSCSLHPHHSPVV